MHVIGGMIVKKMNSTLALMKILSDPRRSQILHLASDKPVTVKYIAEQMGEEPLRLYYHVKKLVEAELLKVAETRQHGNLVEKYYQAVNVGDVIYRGNPEERAEHIELALSVIHRQLDPALRLYQKSLEEIKEKKKTGETFDKLPYQVTINSSTSTKTTKEWRESIEPIMRKIGGDEGDEERLIPIPEDENPDEEGVYQYIVISYKIGDAQRLGLIDSDE